ncbi:MAG: twin-arginine translocase TatA/TatE family subunit [Thermoanaerobaculia bacterium]
MGSLGLPEIAFIFIIALLIFGPKKLPELGRTLGRGMAEFRKATDELKRSINTELALEENPAPAVLRTRRLEDPAETKYHEPVIVAGPREAPEMTEPRSAGFPSSPEPDAVPPGDSAPPDLPEPR